MFVVHRESAGKPNMEFRIHESGIHYYDLRNDESDFIGTNAHDPPGAHFDDDEQLSELTLYS
jgi:hypothetical protein